MRIVDELKADLYMCDCTYEILAIESLTFDEGEPGEVYLQLYEAATGCGLWSELIWRIKMAWETFWRTRTNGGAISFSPNRAEEVGQSILKHAKRARNE